MITHIRLPTDLRVYSFLSLVSRRRSRDRQRLRLRRILHAQSHRRHRLADQLAAVVHRGRNSQIQQYESVSDQLVTVALFLSYCLSCCTLQSINQFYLSHTTRYKLQNARKENLYYMWFDWQVVPKELSWMLRFIWPTHVRKKQYIA